MLCEFGLHNSMGRKNLCTAVFQILVALHLYPRFCGNTFSGLTTEAWILFLEVNQELDMGEQAKNICLKGDNLNSRTLGACDILQVIAKNMEEVGELLRTEDGILMQWS